MGAHRPGYAFASPSQARQARRKPIGFERSLGSSIYGVRGVFRNSKLHIPRMEANWTLMASNAPLSLASHLPTPWSSRIQGWGSYERKRLNGGWRSRSRVRSHM